MLVVYPISTGAPVIDARETLSALTTSTYSLLVVYEVIILEDIEFDLLEPVLERGPIWRIVDNEE